MITVQTPAARAADPITSHEAADDVTRSGLRGQQQRQAREAVEKYPGHTSAELAEKTGLDRFMLARRLPECITGGEVVKGTPRQCRVSRRRAVTWWNRTEQMELLA